MTNLNLREIAVDILNEILEQDGYTHLVLSRSLEKYQYLDKQQRAFLTRLVQGTVEYTYQIDFLINERVKKPKVAKMKPYIRTVLRMSVYQILYMDGVPDSAACNEAVKLVKKHGFSGLSGFVNGVLRSIAREKETITFDKLDVKYSMPEWIVSMWEEKYGKTQTEAMLAAFLADAPTTIRVNTARISVEDLTERLQRQGISVEKVEEIPYALSISGYDYLNAIEEFKEGLFYVQDLSSMMVAYSAEIKEGDYIIDVCAAPGGKSLHAAELLAGTGYVEARDLSDAKVALMNENFKKSALNNLKAKKWDATVRDEDAIEKADILFCDVPCSGLGIIGKKPDIKYHMSLEQIHELATLQREILNTVWQYLKPGGTLMYSTCTISHEENEENVAWFLAEHPEFELLEKKQLLPEAGKCDGFFLARLKRQPC